MRAATRRLARSVLDETVDEHLEAVEKMCLYFPSDGLKDDQRYALSRIAARVAEARVELSRRSELDR